MNLEEKRILLIKQLEREKRIITKKVAQAFLNTRRELFISGQLVSAAYADRPLSIGYDQTISAPHMVAIMVEELDIHPNQKILEIGSGSGYHAAIVSHLVGKKGQVFSIERIPSLAEISKKNLLKAGISNVTVICSDGSEGYEKEAPYDRIYVTCASPGIPDPLIEQLKDNGKLLIPVGDRFCDLQRVTKINNKINIDYLGGCAFVPLIGKYGFK